MMVNPFATNKHLPVIIMAVEFEDMFMFACGDDGLPDDESCFSNGNMGLTCGPSCGVRAN